MHLPKEKSQAGSPARLFRVGAALGAQPWYVRWSECECQVHILVGLWGHLGAPTPGLSPQQGVYEGVGVTYTPGTVFL